MGLLLSMGSMNIDIKISFSTKIDTKYVLYLTDSFAFCKIATANSAYIKDGGDTIMHSTQCIKYQTYKQILNPHH